MYSSKVSSQRAARSPVGRRRRNRAWFKMTATAIYNPLRITALDAASA